MRVTRRFLLLAIAGLLVCLDVAAPQAGPRNRTSETVARPKRKSDTDKGAPEAELPKIPSKYNRRDTPSIPEGTPTFRSDVTTVTVDVAVVDNRGHFIPFFLFHGDGID